MHWVCRSIPKWGRVRSPRASRSTSCSARSDVSLDRLSVLVGRWMIPDTDRAAAGFLFHVIRAAEVDQPEQVVGQSWVRFQVRPAVAHPCRPQPRRLRPGIGLPDPSTERTPAKMRRSHRPGHPLAFAVSRACILPPNLFTIPRELWLREAKATLEKTLAPARPGELCRWCDVRQFCDAYWVAPFGKGTDVELRVAGEPTATGFPGQGSDGELAVVFTADVGR